MTITWIDSRLGSKRKSSISLSAFTLFVTNFHDPLFPCLKAERCTRCPPAVFSSPKCHLGSSAAESPAETQVCPRPRSPITQTSNVQIQICIKIREIQYKNTDTNTQLRHKCAFALWSVCVPATNHKSNVQIQIHTNTNTRCQK